MKRIDLDSEININIERISSDVINVVKRDMFDYVFDIVFKTVHLEIDVKTYQVNNA